MHRFIPLLCIATIVLSCPQCIFAQDREQAITVYSNGLGLVRDMRTIELPRGRSTVTIPQVAAEIDPTFRTDTISYGAGRAIHSRTAIYL
jgi:hypothetical protein